MTAAATSQPYTFTSGGYTPPTTVSEEATSVTTAVVIVTQSVTIGLASSGGLTAGPAPESYEGLFTTSTTWTRTRNVTLTDPINTHIVTVVPANATMTHVNDTSTDADSYINMSTFSASGLTLNSSSHSETLTKSSSSETLTSTKVVRPSATETHSGSETGMLGFTPAATSDVGEHRSSAPKAVVAEGSYLPMLAGFGFAGVFGLFLLL